MRIGFDIDGVLINHEKFQLNKGILFFKKKYIKEYKGKEKIKLKDIQVYDEALESVVGDKKINESTHYITINSNGYGIREVFKCSEKSEKDFWYKYMVYYVLFTPLRTDMKRVLKQLYCDGNEITFITARAKSNEKNLIGLLQRTLVYFRLNIAGIKYKKVEFCSYEGKKELHDKIRACKINNIDCMIEDKKANALAIEKETGIKVFLYATRNNADIKNKDILRIVDPSSLYNSIKRYENGKSFSKLNNNQKQKLTDDDKQKYYDEYREFLRTVNYDGDIIKDRIKNLMIAIKVGSYIIDKITTPIVLNECNIPNNDATIFTTNHRDMLDIPVIMRVVGAKPIFPILKYEFLDTKAAKFLTDIGCIFVSRNDKSIRSQAREVAVRNLLNGNNIILCPEGTRNKTEKDLLDFGFGAVSIAQDSGKLITPCAVYKNGKYRIINFGESFKVNQTDELENANKNLFLKSLELLSQCKEYSKEPNLKLKKYTNKYNNLPI